MSERKKYALIIGNSEYKHANPLKNPRNDAEDLAKVLTDIGFDVTPPLYDLTKKEMQKEITDFCCKIEGHLSFFYFAGHGLQLKCEGRSENFLLPVDTDFTSETDIEDTSVRANYVLKKLKEAGSTVRIIIFDACRKPPKFFGSERHLIAQGLADMDVNEGELIAYSTAAGEVANDGLGRNSPYVKHLKQYLVKPELDVEKIFQETRIAVATETKNHTGYFYQKPKTHVCLLKHVVLQPQNHRNVNSENTSFPSSDIEDLEKRIAQLGDGKTDKKHEMEILLAQAERIYSVKNYDKKDSCWYEGIDGDFWTALQILKQAKREELLLLISIVVRLLEKTDNALYAQLLRYWLEEMQVKYTLDGAKVQKNVNNRLRYIEDCESLTLYFVVEQSRGDENKYSLVMWEKDNIMTPQYDYFEESLSLDIVFQKIRQQLLKKYKDTENQPKIEIFLPRNLLDYASKHRINIEKVYPIVYRCLERNYPLESQEFETLLLTDEDEASDFLGEHCIEKPSLWRKRWNALEKCLKELQEKPERYIMWGCAAKLTDLHDAIDMILANANTLECIFASTKYLAMWQSNGEQQFNVLQKIEDAHTCVMLWNIGREDTELSHKEIMGELIGGITFLGQISLNIQNAKRANKHYRPFCLIVENPYSIPYRPRYIERLNELSERYGY